MLNLYLLDPFKSLWLGGGIYSTSCFNFFNEKVTLHQITNKNLTDLKLNAVKYSRKHGKRVG
jgi:hypothetical protein